MRHGLRLHAAFWALAVGLVLVAQASPAQCRMPAQQMEGNCHERVATGPEIVSPAGSCPFMVAGMPRIDARADDSASADVVAPPRITGEIASSRTELANGPGDRALVSSFAAPPPVHIRPALHCIWRL